MEQAQGDSKGALQLATLAMLLLRARQVVLAKVARLSLLPVRAATLVICLGVSFAFADPSFATIIRFQTTLGNIDARLYDSATPLHTSNILNYINSDRYDGTFIHRSADSYRRDANGNYILDNMGNRIPFNFVVQGGGYKINTSLFGSVSSVQSFGNVPNEPGISNLRGTLALAKSTGISSGTSQWFINLDDDNNFLDQPPPTSNSFTVFGRLIRNTITVADTIASLPTVNAGGAFSELPVTDFAKVIQMQDVTNNEAVVVSDVRVMNYPKGDYNFDGTVNMADYAIWKADYGSTTKAEADGNGNGRIDAADYAIWRNTFGQTSVPGSGSVELDALPAPEPTTAMLYVSGLLACLNAICRRRSSH